jgi:hypothetical protein
MAGALIKGLFLIFSYPDLITLPEDRDLASVDAQKRIDG